MRFFKRKFEYPLIAPPFKVKQPLREMTRKEAREHFEWFVAQSPSRRDLLIRSTVFEGTPEHMLDYSPESLAPLWERAIPYFKYDQPSRKELRRLLAESPEWVRQAYRTGTFGFGELSVVTRCLCIDIGFYLAEVLMREHPEVEWALWTLKTGPYHMPYLRPFDPPLVPEHLAGGCAASAAAGRAATAFKRDRSPDLLLQKHHHWKAKLE